MKKTSLLIAFFLPFSLMAEKKDKAEFQKKLMEFYHSFDTPTNVSKAEIYQSQKAGHATGGGLVIRNRIKELGPVTVNLPKIEAGCGGIDIYAGGFSYINSEELIDTLKSIGTSASGYAFLLAMETVSPQVAGAIKQLQSWSNSINSIGINSCEIASTMVGSMWPRETMAKEHICRTANLNKHFGSDFIAKRQNCTGESVYKVQADPNAALELLVDENNITWECLRQQSYVASDTTLSEIMMNIVGTIISNDIGDKLYYPSRLSDDVFLKFILEGGNDKIYRCKNNSDNKCLTIELENIVISKEESWMGKIRKNLETIQHRILNDTELDESQKDLLTRTRVPLFQVMNVITAYRNGNSPIDIYQVAEIVAVDLLLKYLHETVDMIEEGCKKLKSHQKYNIVIEEFLSQLRDSKNRVHYYEIKQHLFDREMQLMQTIETLEEKLYQQIKLF